MSHVSADGVIRNAQMTREVMTAEIWDGRANSYIPAPELQIDAALELHTDADPQLDPVTYQVWSAFGATVADAVHIYQRPRRLRMPADPAPMNATFAELDLQGREALEAEGFDRSAIELHRSLRMKYSAQVFDVEVPLQLAGELDAEDVDWLNGELQRVYESLHGEGSAHPEGGAEITAFAVRARGVIDRPVLAAPVARQAPRPDAREVYWHELGGYTPTPVITLEAGATLTGRLEGPLLLELPDTVIVLRPGQSGQFADNGSLVIEV